MSLDIVAKHAFAYGGSDLLMPDEHTIAYVCGNALNFTSTVTNSQHFLQRSRPREIVAFDCNWKNNEIAVVARETNPDIFLYTFPDKKIRLKLHQSTPTEYTLVKFSRCGKRLLSASAAEEGSQRICLWELTKGDLIHAFVVAIAPQDLNFVSFDPSNFDHFVIGSSSKSLDVYKIYNARGSCVLRHTNMSKPKAFKSTTRALASTSTNVLMTRMNSSVIENPIEDKRKCVDSEADLETRRSQYACHCWTKGGKLYVANRNGELVLIDTATCRFDKVIEQATRSSGASWNVGICSLVCTADYVIVFYFDGEVCWLDGKDHELIQSASIADSIREKDLSSIVTVAPSPSFSKVCIGTRAGIIYELRTHSGRDEDEAETKDANDLLAVYSSFHPRAVFACTAVTPCGGSFNADTLLASGGVNGNLFFWSVAKCRLVLDVNLENLFEPTNASLSPTAVAVDADNGQKSQNGSNPSVTALSARSVDPVLLVGDQCGRLRIVCASRLVGDGSIEVLPLHSIQMFDGNQVDLMTLHPFRPFVLVASTQENQVFVLAVDHEQHFQVVAYLILPEETERVVDAKWCVSSLNAYALTFTCVSSRGRLYVGNIDDSEDRPVKLPHQCIGVLDEMLIVKCMLLVPLNATGTTMLLGMSPFSNDILLIKLSESADLSASATNAAVRVQTKVLVQDAHEHGIACVSHCQRSLRNGEETFVTGGMNGVATIWLVTFGGAEFKVASSKVTREIQIEDVQAVKKKSVAMHQGPVTCMSFLHFEEELLLLTTGSDTCVFMMDIRMSPELRSPLGPEDQVMNSLYVNVASFAKYDEGFKSNEDTTKPCLQLIREAHEAATRSKFDRVKDKTRAPLNELEMKLRGLLADNERLPETERLSREEFVVNTEWRDRLLQMNKERAQRVRENITNDITKMSIVRQRMKSEFWDNALIKGKKLRSLQPNSSLFVYNFPMRKPSKRELHLQSKIDLLRLVEHQYNSEERSDHLKKPNFTSRFAKLVPLNLQWMIDAGLQHPTLNRLFEKIKILPIVAPGKKGEEATGESGGAGKTLSNASSVPAGIGQGASGGPSPSLNTLKGFSLVYHPAAIRTRKQQRIQIQLLRAFERALLTEFNSEFSETLKLKESKMEEIETKNARIQEICGELGITYDLFHPSWAPDEIENSILDVRDDEMTQKVYETEEMRNKREREASEKQERERRLQKDDVAGRALQDMMNGTLETKKDNAIQKSLVKEQWMIDTPPEEMTPEQKKLVQLFEAAQQKFQEEKEKYRKSLDSELKKIKAEISEICRLFDEKLKALQELYMFTRTTVLIQQLYELRLAEDLMEHEHLLHDQTRLQKEIHQLEVDLKKNEKELESFSHQVEFCREEWQHAAEEDKSLEKNFARELEDVLGGNPIDHELMKHVQELYKKRKAEDNRDENARKNMKHRTTKGHPLVARAGSKRLMNLDSSGSAAVSGASLPTAMLLQTLQGQNSDSKIEIEVNYDPLQGLEFDQKRTEVKKVTPLDPEVDRTDGVTLDETMWNALNDLRTKKILAEYAVKEKAELLAQARSVSEEMRNKSNETHKSLEQQLKRLHHTQNQLTALANNAPLLVHIKQGQDEASSEDVFENSSDAVLVNRATVESLNDVILLHGKDQVGVLNKIKNFRKNINVMEWEHNLLSMQIHDIEERYTDIQLLRVTKDLQELFHSGDTSERQKREIALMEAKLLHLGKTHQATMSKLEKNNSKLQRQLKERERENEAFEEQVQKLEMQVQIREDILMSRRSAVMRNTTLTKSTAKAGGSLVPPQEENTRLKAITVRRKLVDLAKSQTDEIEALRQELDRMRRRTFPSFVSQPKQ